MKPSMIYDLTATTTIANQSVTDAFRRGSTAVGKVIW